MHQSTTPSLSQTIWPRWASRQFLSLPSPDLAPCDFWLFSKLKGCRYETIEEMKEAVTKIIDMLTQEDFHGTFQKLLEWYKCIAAGGDYFEGNYFINIYFYKAFFVCGVTYLENIYFYKAFLYVGQHTWKIYISTKFFCMPGNIFEKYIFLQSFYLYVGWCNWKNIFQLSFFMWNNILRKYIFPQSYFCTWLAYIKNIYFKILKICTYFYKAFLYSVTRV